jgi:hypothetical protein
MQPLARKISRSRHQSVRTRRSSFQVQVVSCAAIFFLLHFLATHQLESNLNSESILLDSKMASVHQRYACMGCTARGGEPTYFNDYQSAAAHYARSQSCSKSSRWIKTVSDQIHTRPQYVGDGEAFGGGAAGAWCPQPAPSRRPGGNDIIEHNDIIRLRYHQFLRLYALT